MEAAGGPHFGALLRGYRLAAGLTQQELAERAKVSVEAISLLERGARTRPHGETVALLGRALELSPDSETLLRRAGDTPHPPRRRERGEGLTPSLLRIVHHDEQTMPNHNLPQQMTSFVGREHELDKIAELLRLHRLVTIVGSGGVGKTRVAVQLASDVVDSPDGAWLVDLAPLTDQTLVASAILTALQLRSTTGSALEAVVAYLKTRRLLLILDNCEHVIARARDVAAKIVQSCPHVRVLATSREALDVRGEWVYRLPSLSVPPDSRGSARDALPYAAFALFVDRAVAVDAGFALTDDNAPDIAEICRRLDGIPLAIELAAARVKALTPRQITQRLDERFRLLTGGDPTALPRQQTMRALLDWSYDLLTPREQLFFESLSVFAGGCTLEAAAAVCATEEEGDIEVIDLIASLVTKSLLLAELAGQEQRYRLLDSSRQYAHDKLEARGTQEQVAQRHALAYLEVAQRLEREWETTPDRAWFSQVNVEVENWRAALAWTLGALRDVDAGLQLVAARNVVWRSFSLVEARRWVRAALALVDERTPSDLAARLEHAEAEGAQQFGEREAAFAAAERALLRYRDSGDTLGRAQAQCLAGRSLALLGRNAEAEPLLRKALETARTLGDCRLTASVLQVIGWTRSETGDYAGARAYLAEALALATALGADFSAASLAASLAENEFNAGDPETALRLTADVLANLRALNSPPIMPGIAAVFANMATFLVALGRYDEARTRALEALELARDLGHAALVALSLRHLAMAAMLRPQPQAQDMSKKYAATARLFGFLEAHRANVAPQEYSLEPEYERGLAVLRGAIGADVLTKLMAAGATMTEDEAIDQARAL